MSLYYSVKPSCSKIDLELETVVIKNLSFYALDLLQLTTF